MAQPTPSPDDEPTATILQSVGGYAIKINFRTMEAAIEYARQHNLKTKVTSYGY